MDEQGAGDAGVKAAFDLDLPLALWFYEEFIRKPHEEKRVLRQHFGFAGGRPGSSEDWELFAAILLKSGRNAASRYGHDLTGAEVKSARVGSSFEYQYHLNTGLAKLDAEHSIEHVFVSYDEDSLTVRVVSGVALQALFQAWREPLLKNYDAADSNRRQRFRKSIPYGVVAREGQVLLRLQKGQVVGPAPPTPEARAEAQARGQALLATVASEEPDPAS